MDPSLDQIPLPPQEIRFMHEDDAGIIRVGSHLAKQLYRLGLDKEKGCFYDVGFGYGRVALGMMHTGFQGHYGGFEIMRKNARWCRENLEPLFDGRYTFRHLNVVSGRYNKSGKIAAADVRFPTDDESQDMVGVYSVFTHMYEADIQRYLHEIRRVLRPGGLALTTWFVYNDEILPKATDPASTRFPMTNEINAVTRYTEAEDPLRAIAFDEDHVRNMITAAGLVLKTFERGSWWNTGKGEFQDYLLLEKPALTPLKKARRVAGKVKRRGIRTAKAVRSKVS